MATRKHEAFKGFTDTVDVASVNLDFSLRYNFAPHEIAGAEDFIRRHATQVGLLVHPVLQRIIEVDLADTIDRPVYQ
jgi:hypothetical protein